MTDPMPSPAPPVAAGRRHWIRRHTPILALAAAILAGLAIWWRSPPPELPPAGGTPLYWGVNLAGAEFAPDHPDAAYGREYIYPDAKVAEPFAARGMNAIRLPILWERIQPWPQAMLSPNESKRLDEGLDALGDFALVIIDVHNYGHLQGAVLSGDDASAERFADLWHRLAERYRDRPNVAFGLMNEPNGIDPPAWRRLAERAVAAIRATGATNLILVPGANWTSAVSWEHGGSASNARAFEGFADPGNNMAFEMHQYLDADFGGHSDQCVPRKEAVERLADATQWLRRSHYRGFLGEFAAGPSPQCLDSLDGLLDTLKTNGDVWMGWTYWAGGPWWGDAWTSIQPDREGRDKPQMAIVARYIGAR